MGDSKNGLSRRDFLALTGTALAGASVFGLPSVTRAA